jgi:hypothetical protein
MSQGNVSSAAIQALIPELRSVAAVSSMAQP